MSEPREWYMRVPTGDRGYVVYINGEKHVRLDRPNMPKDMITFPFSDAKWRAEVVNFPVTRMQLAEVAFSADVALCKVLSLHKHKKKWFELSDHKKQLWAYNGPKSPDIRAGLWHSIMDRLEGHEK